MLPTERVRTSPAPCTTTALQENEYEIHNRHAFAHDICHNRCGCAGWKRAWSPQAADHRHTAGTCADDCFADKAAVKAFPAQVGIGFNDEIAANRSRQGLRGSFGARGELSLRRVHHGTVQPFLRARLGLESVQVRSIAILQWCGAS